MNARNNSGKIGGPLTIVAAVVVAVLCCLGPILITVGALAYAAHHRAAHHDHHPARNTGQLALPLLTLAAAGVSSLLLVTASAGWPGLVKVS